MSLRYKLGILLLISLTSCVKPLADTGVIEWDLSSLDLPQMEYNGKIYYIHPDAGEMSYHEAVDYCKRLTAYNHSDWFLPGQQELAQMFEESSRIGGFTSGDYWFENPYARMDEERSMSYRGGVSDFGKARVRPVRCENTFTPTITLKQIHDGNWSTFQVTIPQSSRYTVNKAGLCWSDKAGSGSRIKIAESDKKEGTFYVSIDYNLTRLKTMYLSAFSELSDGSTIYSNEITLIPHEPIVEFTLKRKDDTKVQANITIKDWGFPENFKYIRVFLSDSEEMYSYSRKELDIKEETFHYEEEWNMQDGTLYLFFNPFSQAGLNTKATFSAVIARETKSPRIKTLPVTNKTTVKIDDNENLVYSMSLNCELLEKGYPEATNCGILISSKNPKPTIEDNEKMFNEKSTWSQQLRQGVITFDDFLITPTGPIYLRAFATNENGTVYGETVSEAFVQPSIKDVTVSNITATSAKLTGTIVEAGDPEYTERGFVYFKSYMILNSSKIDLYTLYKHKSTIPNNNITGSWSMNISDLSGGTDYMVFSYVAEGNVVWFSQIQEFSTL